MSLPTTFVRCCLTFHFIRLVEIYEHVVQVTKKVLKVVGAHFVGNWTEKRRVIGANPTAVNLPSPIVDPPNDPPMITRQKVVMKQFAKISSRLNNLLSAGFLQRSMCIRVFDRYG